MSVSEGRLTLKEITGSGVRVTVLKEETVMPRKEGGGMLLLLVVVLGEDEGSVAVIIETG